jgi:hypothetical protein
MRKSRGKVEITPEELIAVLRKTTIPTVIVEGDDDIIVLRRLEEIYPDRLLSVQPADGRNEVLKIFNDRHTLPNSAKIVFVADRDTWVLTNIPAEYEDDCLFFSDGYSIENDAFRDGKFFDLMDSEEKNKFNEDIKNFVYWFAHCACKFMNSEPIKLKTHPSQILDQEHSPSLSEIVHDDDMRELYTRLIEDHAKLLRGKALIGILMRQLSRSGRRAKHHSKALLDIAGASPGPLLKQLFDEIGQATA